MQQVRYKHFCFLYWTFIIKQDSDGYLEPQRHFFVACHYACLLCKYDNAVGTVLRSQMHFLNVMSWSLIIAINQSINQSINLFNMVRTLS